MSKKPNKTRKEQNTMDMHKRSKAIAAHLNEKLQKELGTRSIPLRKNDTIKVMRGEYKGKTGKIIRINRISMKVFVEGIIKKKSDGTEYDVAIDPSNLLVIEIEKIDQKRLKNLKTKKEEKSKKEGK